MQVGFSFEVDDRELMRGIMGELRSHINNVLRSVVDDVKSDLQDVAEKLLINSNEYKSIQSGVLATQLEIQNPQQALQDVINVVRNNIDVTFVPVSSSGTDLRGGLNIVMLRQGIQELLTLSSGTYQGKLFEVPWLNWLLTQGDRIIVAGYNINVKYTLSPADRANARSGIEIMEKGGGWRVPPQFSGTEDANWISRTFDVSVMQREINSIVEKRLIKGFS